MSWPRGSCSKLGEPGSGSKPRPAANRVFGRDIESAFGPILQLPEHTTFRRSAAKPPDGQQSSGQDALQRPLWRNEWLSLIGPVKRVQEGRCFGQGYRADPVNRHARCPGVHDYSSGQPGQVIEGNLLAALGNTEAIKLPAEDAHCGTLQHPGVGP